MSEQPQHPSDPQAPDKAPRPPEPPTETPSSPPQPEKNRRSSVYVYLAVLFGAAFLMLLLAYFVQQRNNATAMDDLRTTSTASRQELLEQIQELEEKRDWLQNAYDLQRERNDRVDEQIEDLQERSDQYWEALIRMTTWYDNDYTLDCLERFVRDRDYLMAATIVFTQDGMFDRNTAAYSSSSAWDYLTPANEERYLELREELSRKSGLMTLTREGDGSGYPPGLPRIIPGAFTEEELDAASSLWAIIRYYAIDPDWAAQLLETHYEDIQERGDDQLFRPSTMDLLEEIKTDLIAQGLLTEADGELISNVSWEHGVDEESWEPLSSDPPK